MSFMKISSKRTPTEEDEEERSNGCLNEVGALAIGSCRVVIMTTAKESWITDVLLILLPTEGGRTVGFVVCEVSKGIWQRSPDYLVNDFSRCR